VKRNGLRICMVVVSDRGGQVAAGAAAHDHTHT